MYLEKLTREDIEELERVVMDCDSFDRQQTQIHIDGNQNLYVVFWEEIPPDDDEPEQEKHYAETRYVYYDFDPPDICDWSPSRYGRKGDEHDTAGKIEWYANRLKEVCAEEKKEQERE